MGGRGLDPAEWRQRYFAADELAGHTPAGFLSTAAKVLALRLDPGTVNAQI